MWVQKMDRDNNNLVVQMTYEEIAEVGRALGDREE